MHCKDIIRYVNFLSISFFLFVDLNNIQGAHREGGKEQQQFDKVIIIVWSKENKMAQSNYVIHKKVYREAVLCSSWIVCHISERFATAYKKRLIIRRIWPCLILHLFPISLPSLHWYCAIIIRCHNHHFYRINTNNWEKEERSKQGRYILTARISKKRY